MRKSLQGCMCPVFSLQRVGTKMSLAQFWRSWPSQSRIYRLGADFRP